MIEISSCHGTTDPLAFGRPSPASHHPSGAAARPPVDAAHPDLAETRSLGTSGQALDDQGKARPAKMVRWSLRRTVGDADRPKLIMEIPSPAVREPLCRSSLRSPLTRRSSRSYCPVIWSGPASTRYIHGTGLYVRLVIALIKERGHQH